MMMQDYFCETCDATIQGRQLHTVSAYVESYHCPRCKRLLGQRERESSSPADFGLAEDVAAVDAWLDAGARALNLKATADRSGEGTGEYCWQVSQGVPGRECEAIYLRRRPGVVELRLMSAMPRSFTLPEFQEACARHGLQPVGRRATPFAAAVEGAAVGPVAVGPEQVTAGVRQLLDTNTLTPGLVVAVLARLTAALKEVTADLGRG